LTKFQDKFASKGFTVMAVNGYDESKEEVQEFVNDKKLKHPILLKGGETALKLYGVEGYPTSFWINHEGRIVGKEVGFSPEMEPAIEKRIEKLLAAREKK